MTSSTISHQSEQPQAVPMPRRKERSQPTLWAIAILFFIMGAAASTATIWQLHKLYRATVAPPVAVEGVVKAQYDYDKVEALNPPPGGYYIESSGTGRVYLSGKPLQQYVGQTVVATGSVAGICGPKSIPCYPLLELREVKYPEAE
ncbi:MAG: hypothetical protein ACFB16_04780 [Phormidesmis sp.]